MLIVGSGPTGATMALALAGYGIRCHMISRWNWLADSPRAHITNQRTMEVFRDLGIEDDVRKSATPWELMGDTLFTTSLAGEELVRLRSWGTGDERRSDYLTASPCAPVDIIQPALEPVLLNTAAARGASFSFNTEYLSHEQDADGVSARLKDRLTDREFTIRARYLVGADGARSTVAGELGLPIEGRMGRAGTAYVIFNADLTRYVQHRPSMLYWILAAGTSFGEIGMGLLRAVRPWTRWIAGWGFDLAKGPELDESTVRAHIAALIGDPDVEVQLVKSSVWYVNQAYATAYSKGRVFCGGDAVHRHPRLRKLLRNNSVRGLKGLVPLLLIGTAGLTCLLFLSEPGAHWLTSFLAPPPARGAVVARLVRADGSVQRVHGGDVQKLNGPLSAPLELHDGDRIETGRQSQALLILNSQDEVEMQPLTSMTLQLWNERDPFSPLYLSLLNGDMDLQKSGVKGRAYVVREGRLYLPGQKPEKKALALTVLRSAPLDMELAGSASASDSAPEFEADRSLGEEKNRADLALNLKRCPTNTSMK